MNTQALAEYLRTEIPAQELSALLDELLHNMVEWIHRTGQPWSAEEVSMYHHVRELRDLFAGTKAEQPQAIAS